MSDAGDTTTWEHLVRFQRQTLSTLDTSLRQKFELTLDDYDVLHQLTRAEEPLRMTDLAQRLLVANSSCNRIVGRLIERGLLERSSGSTDRREVRIALTADGRRLHRRMAARHTRDIQQHFGHRLSATEHDYLQSIFTRLLIPLESR